MLLVSRTVFRDAGGSSNRSHELPHDLPSNRETRRDRDRAVCHPSDKEYSMKKFTVRKAGTVRLTSAASTCYCGGGTVLA